MDEHSGWLAALQAACAHEACSVNCECTVEDTVSISDMLAVKHANHGKFKVVSQTYCIQPRTSMIIYAWMFCSCLKDPAIADPAVLTLFWSVVVVLFVGVYQGPPDFKATYLSYSLLFFHYFSTSSLLVHSPPKSGFHWRWSMTVLTWSAAVRSWGVFTPLVEKAPAPPWWTVAIATGSRSEWCWARRRLLSLGGAFAEGWDRGDPCQIVLIETCSSARVGREQPKSVGDGWVDSPGNIQNFTTLNQSCYIMKTQSHRQWGHARPSRRRWCPKLLVWEGGRCQTLLPLWIPVCSRTVSGCWTDFQRDLPRIVIIFHHWAQFGKVIR